MNEKQLAKINQNRTVPLFDCDYHRFDEHLEFYTAMGFQLIYYQKAPYRFASVTKETIGEFGFYGARNFEEEGNQGGCYVHVPDVRAVYEELRKNLKAYYGKLPLKGMPKISRLNKTAEDWRVNITDPSGNTIIIGEAFGDSTELMEKEAARVKALKSTFEKGYAAAYRFAHSKEDYLAGRNTLEVAFAQQTEKDSCLIVFQAKVLQAEVFYN
ncbi:hypothetical protein JCM19046_2925 [Bacillus sp. JCM 19046]|nr:hypothetical protein JCM19045_500 [Bacillus sp. JCM 19045]GAF18354.1 hypothetical protein JCM19046_2925 [Bacillus sp. JCM 19046]